MERDILIAESSEILRAGLQTILLMGDQCAMRIHEAATKKELHTQLHSKFFDRILVNQALITDISILPRGRFVILAATLDRDVFQSAYRHGAQGYLLGSTSVELLRAALCLEEGNFLIDPSLTAPILDVFSSDLCFSPQDHLLSPREREVIGLLREGVNRKLIAQQLHISETTLKTHIKHIRRKTVSSQ